MLCWHLDNPKNFVEKPYVLIIKINLFNQLVRVNDCCLLLKFNIFLTILTIFSIKVIFFNAINIKLNHIIMKAFI